MQIKGIISCRMKSSLKWLSHIFKNMIFYPPPPKKTDFLCNLSKYKIFKKRITCFKVMPGHLAYQVLGWYIYFWQTYSPKTIFVDDVIFSNYDFEHCLTSHRNKSDILGILRSDWFRNTHFYSKISIQNFYLTYMTRGWPDPSLSLTCMWSDCKMASIFEFYVQKRPLITCRMPQNELLILVTFRDLTWPWSVLSMTPMLTGYLQ